MGEFGIRYHAVISYDFNGGERIIFVQSTTSDPKKVAWACKERFPTAGSYYCVQSCKKPINIHFMHASIFSDIAVAYMVGVTAKELGYSIDDLPQCYTQIRLYIEGLPYIICADKYGIAFTDFCTKEALFNGTARTWEGREEKSLYRVLEKMLSRIKNVCGMDYDIRNFI